MIDHKTDTGKIASEIEQKDIGVALAIVRALQGMDYKPTGASSILTLALGMVFVEGWAGTDPKLYSDDISRNLPATITSLRTMSEEGEF